MSLDSPIVTWALQHKVDNNTWQVEYVWKSVSNSITTGVSDDASFGTAWLLDSIKSQNQRHGIPILFRNVNTGVMTVEFEITYSTAFNNWAQNNHSRLPQISDLSGISPNYTAWTYPGNGLNYGLEVILL